MSIWSPRYPQVNDMDVSLQYGLGGSWLDLVSSDLLDWKSERSWILPLVDISLDSLSGWWQPPGKEKAAQAKWAPLIPGSTALTVGSILTLAMLTLFRIFYLLPHNLQMRSGLWLTGKCRFWGGRDMQEIFIFLDLKTLRIDNDDHNWTWPCVEIGLIVV